MRKTQVEAAEAIGVSRSYLAGLESGQDLPGRDTLIAICGYYNIPLTSVTAALSNGAKGRVELIEDPTELALLDAWRAMPETERTFVNRLIRLPSAKVNEPA